MYIFYSSLGASQVVLAAKNLPANTGDVRGMVHSLGWEGPLEDCTETHSSTLAWRIPWTEPLEMSPGREAACRAVFGTWGFFRTMHGKTAPSC